MASPREKEIYLDHNATTPLDPRVAQAMAECWAAGAGNPHSKTHKAGWRAAEQLEQARRQVAALVGCGPECIIFTSGATEANNLVILGLAASCEASSGPGHIVSSSIEHPSVREPLAALAKRGWRVEEIPVGPEGFVAPNDVAAALCADTRLVTVMAANNETGTLQPVSEIAAICRGADVPYLSDCAQAAGKITLSPFEKGPTMISLSAHKFYGPMGIGALVLSPEIALQPVTFGGGQERGLRPGTIPLPLAVGFGLAAEIAAAERVEEAQRLAGLAMRLRDGLQEIYPEMVLNGDWHARLPGTLNVRFPSIEAEELLLALPNLQLSTGSACGSGRTEPSYVLRSLGLLAEEIAQSIRIGLGRTTTEEDIETALRDFATALEKLR